MVRRALWIGGALAALVAGVFLFLRRSGPAPPADLTGFFVYVSDRDGVEALYERRLPRGEERRLTFLSEPLRDPAVSKL